MNKDRIHLSFDPRPSEAAPVCGAPIGTEFRYSELASVANCAACVNALMGIAEYASEMCQKECHEEDWDVMETLVGNAGLPNGRT